MKNQPGPITGSLIHLCTLHLNKMDYWPTLKSAVKNQPHPFTLSLPTSSEPYFNSTINSYNQKWPMSIRWELALNFWSCLLSLKVTQNSETSGFVNFPYFRLRVNQNLKIILCLTFTFLTLPCIEKNLIYSIRHVSFHFRCCSSPKAWWPGKAGTLVQGKAEANRRATSGLV